MNLYSKFQNGDKERDGITVTYGKNDKGENIDFIIARAGGTNERYLKVLEQVTKPYRRQLQNNLLEPFQFRSLMAEVYAKSVILGWNGVEDADGNELPFSQDNVIKVLTDLPELFDDLQTVANERAAFNSVQLEADAKN